MRRLPQTPPELRGYSFVKLLGTGGFSDVFLYEQALPKRNVAVKVLLADDLAPASRDAFVAEANLMAQLSAHPYIVTIFHADVTDDERPYFVMEYCSGPSLAERYKRETFSVSDALRIGVRLSGAIATAHAAGILHRDIKPGNVLTNDYGWPALTDFGISSSLEEELPVHTTTAGTGLEAGGTTGGGASVGLSVPWSPSEMFEDDPQPDVRSDVFSLAATIWTLLAGRSPFEIPGRSNGTLDLIGRIERGAITPLGRDDVPRSLVAVLQKGMSLRSADRFATAIDFGRALQRVELELGYSPTTIEVPNLELEQVAVDGGEDGDETRVRSVATIEAQPLAPASPTMPGRIEAPASPPSEEPTRARSVTTIQPESIPRTDASEVVDRTQLRRPATPASEDTVARPRVPVPPPPAAPAPAEAPPEASPDPARRRSRRGLVTTLVIAGALVVVGGGVTAAILSTGVPEPETTNQARGGTGGDPADAIVGGGVPAPIDGAATRGDGNTSVTFVWKNPAPQDGDAYRWWRSEQPGSVNATKEALATIAPVDPASRVCITVELLRGGKTGTPAEFCNP